MLESRLGKAGFLQLLYLLWVSAQVNTLQAFSQLQPEGSGKFIAPWAPQPISRSNPNPITRCRGGQDPLQVPWHMVLVPAATTEVLVFMKDALILCWKRTKGGTPCTTVMLISLVYASSCPKHNFPPFHEQSSRVSFSHLHFIICRFEPPRLPQSLWGYPLVILSWHHPHSCFLSDGFLNHVKSLSLLEKNYSPVTFNPADRSSQEFCFFCNFFSWF